MHERFRLRKSGDFQLVRSEGRSSVHPLLVLYARRNERESTRAGFSVGKRVGKAVTRNRVKRLLREAVRLRLAAIAPGWDLLFIARAPIAEADFAAVSAAVEQLLQRSGLLSSPPAPERGPRRATSVPERKPGTVAKGEEGATCAQWPSS